MKTGTGADSWVMALVWLCLAMAVNVGVGPWFSMPELAHRGVKETFTVWNVGQSLQKAGGLYGVVSPTELALDPVTQGWIWAVQVIAGVTIPLLALSAVLAYQRQGKAVALVRLSGGLCLLLTVGTVVVLTCLNTHINAALGQGTGIWDLTVLSHMQLTGFSCGQGVMGMGMLVWGRTLLDTQRKQYASIPFTGRRRYWTIVVVMLGIPLLIAFGLVVLKGRSYYFISICIILGGMLRFFASFEDRKPQARELVLIATLVVMATTGRAMFFMLPHFKPVTALVIVAGIGLGAEAGFLTGALSGFVSNFLFGQGPWTPWQMFAFGLIGWLAGLLFERQGRRGILSMGLVCVFGWVSTVVIYGGIMDTSTALSMLNGLTWDAVLACYVAGLPVNVAHGSSTVVFLLLASRPMLKKIHRICTKYGLLSRE